ncbi:MAG: isochorismate synthase [Dysgonomonas sp.]
MFKNIDLLIKQNTSFAIYRLPYQQEPILIIGNKHNTQIVYSIKELNNLKGFVIAPFKITEEKPIVCIQPELIISGCKNIAVFFQDMEDKSTIENTSLIEQSDSHYLAYKSAFDKFSQALSADEFKKLVLSHPSDYQAHSKIPFYSILEKAMEAYPSSFIYLCHTAQTGTWVGSTPELLLKGMGADWQTVALAGTQERKSSHSDYEWDSKNLLEQELVSGYIKQLLESYKLNYTQHSSLTAEIGELAHLKTAFSFQLKDSLQLFNLLESLHPTPAVCGLPKEKAYSFILNEEGYDRSYYSGFIGYLDLEQETSLYVNIRCMNIDSARLRLYAGGGLLASSELDSEWKETEAKLQIMLSLLN